MKQAFSLLFSFFIFSLVSCTRVSRLPRTTAGDTAAKLVITGPRPASIGLIGDTADVTSPVDGGVVLMGGSTDVDAAFTWMLQRSGGGDVVVIRAAGTAAYNPYINRLGKINSVETLKIDSRELADNDTVATIIRTAEMLFIAGGDQSNYMRYWKGTKTCDAINYLLTEKRAPVGGTSAGCAILGGFYYSGENGSAVSSEALLDPYHKSINVYNNDFIKAPFLQQVITDQHYLARNREGRSLVFLGRINKDWNTAASIIAVDERTAVCIDKDGKAKVFGLTSPTRPFSNAYFIASRKNREPEQLQPGKPVIWNHDQKALSVYEITASEKGNGEFDVASFSIDKAKGGKRWCWWIDNGVLVKKEQ